jgi:hypothetical protein
LSESNDLVKFVVFILFRTLSAEDALVIFAERKMELELPLLVVFVAIVLLFTTDVIFD